MCYTAPLSYGYSVAGHVMGQEYGDVTFVTGGIGDEEREAMQEMRRDYNLHIMRSEKDGAFTGETNIIIYDRNGNEILAIEAGPLFYINLPVGKI